MDLKGGEAFACLRRRTLLLSNDTQLFFWSSARPLASINIRLRHCVRIAALDYRNRNLARYDSFFAITNVCRNIRLFIIRSANADNFALLRGRHIVKYAITINISSKSAIPTNASVSGFIFLALLLRGFNLLVITKNPAG